ncbi:MAG: hypothetical protein Q4D81_07715, partial [Eubacteriales bacterium]|nr:hypothetical protein [Eubacteriales bacterium]
GSSGMAIYCENREGDRNGFLSLSLFFLPIFFLFIPVKTVQFRARDGTCPAESQIPRLHAGA